MAHEHHTHTHEDTCHCETAAIHENIVNHVKEDFPPLETFEELALFFKVLGDPTRTRIMWALEQHEMCVSDLCVLLNMTKSAISHQLALLRQANLVKNRREGKTIYYSLSDDHVKELFEAGFEHINE